MWCKVLHTEWLSRDCNGECPVPYKLRVVSVLNFTGKDLSSETQATCAPPILHDPEPLFLPQLNNGNDDFIIVCFPDNDKSPNVDANIIHLPIQSIKIPLQLVGTVESTSEMERELSIMSPETPVNRYYFLVNYCLKLRWYELGNTRVQSQVQRSKHSLLSEKEVEGKMIHDV